MSQSSSGRNEWREEWRTAGVKPAGWKDPLREPPNPDRLSWPTAILCLVAFVAFLAVGAYGWFQLLGA